MDRNVRRVARMLHKAVKLEHPDTYNWVDLDPEDKEYLIEWAELAVSGVNMLVDVALERIARQDERRG